MSCGSVEPLESWECSAVVDILLDEWVVVFCTALFQGKTVSCPRAARGGGVATATSSIKAVCRSQKGKKNNLCLTYVLFYRHLIILSEPQLSALKPQDSPETTSTRPSISSVTFDLLCCAARKAERGRGRGEVEGEVALPMSCSLLPSGSQQCWCLLESETFILKEFLQSFR